MTGRRRTLWPGFVGVLLVQGCVHRPADKPLLTERRFARVAATCHARGAAFHRQKGSILPYVDVRDDGDANRAEPTLDCLHRVLSRYRYAFIGVIEPEQAPVPSR